MKKSKSYIILKLSIMLFTGIFTFNTAWASQPEPPIRIWSSSISDDKAYNIGTQYALSMDISINIPYQSAVIEFQVTPFDGREISNSIQIDNITLPLNSRGPFTIKAPVTITGEGGFDIIAKLRVQSIPTDQTTATNNVELVDVREIGFFVFNGKYTIASIADSALEKMAMFQLSQQDSNGGKLINKVSKNILETGDRNISQEASRELSSYISDEISKIKKAYFKKYPKVKCKLIKKAYRTSDFIHCIGRFNDKEWQTAI